MNVLIKGLEIPEEGAIRVVIQKHRGITVAYTGGDPYRRAHEVVELPEKHGDLIDRDALIEDLTNGIKAGLLLDGYEEYPNINNADDCVECVKYADAVIKAEGE